MDSAMEKPQISENFPPSISSVLPPISSMEDQPLPSTPKVSSTGVISILKSSVPIKIPEYTLRDSSPAAILGNNGVLEGSNMVTPLQNVMGKKKGSMDQGNRDGKPTHSAEEPNQSLSTFGNAEKPASKVEACPSKNVEGSKMVAPSKNVIGKKKGTKDQCDIFEKPNENLKHAMLQHQVPFSSLGNAQKLASKEKACSSIIVECQYVQLGGVASSGHSDVQQCDSYGSNMDGLIRRLMSLKYYQPFQSGNRTYVSPPLEVVDDGSKAWKNCLVGNFIEKKLPFTLVKNISIRIWGCRGLLEVLANENGFYFFKFSDDEACSNVLEADPWLFTGRMLILKKWLPRLILTKDTYS
ncbi:hypothetical protein Ddye_005181 [Dipteronia dyeriana]|uniref:DUF4283 domain-containing protein n=1 Tax=Dipteronia dyeriana TaxID=168575 RepID=A0AAE0CQ08_9ROSI|nr:hypothetical protein Ddye_005181 [Dipteronia dyeriana]